MLKNIEVEESYRETVDLTPYEGVYCSGELSAVWILKINQGRLEIIHPRIDAIRLKNTGTDKFGFIEFKRNGANKVTGLKALGEGIEFNKMD